MDPFGASLAGFCFGINVGVKAGSASASFATAIAAAGGTAAPATTVAATAALATASAVFVPAACLVASVGFGVLGAWKLLDSFALAFCPPVEFHAQRPRLKHVLKPHLKAHSKARASSRCLPTLLLSQHSHGGGKPDELALHRGSLCAAKTMNDSNEAKILQVLSGHGHPYILQMLASLRMGSQDYLVTETVLGGELEEFICLSLEEVRFYAACIALALQHLHSLCVGHFDLKGSNFLVDERGYLEVIDFGMAAILDGPSVVPKRSDAHYLAPEVMQVGFFLYYAFLGRLPFADADDLPTDIYNAILYDHSPPDCSEICEIDRSLAELVERLLCRCPEKRPQCKDFFGFMEFVASSASCAPPPAMTSTEEFPHCPTAV